MSVLDYKRPAFWLIIAAAIIAIIILAVILTSNPIKDEHPETISGGYNIELLMENKSQYIGNNSKVGALINAMPLPEGVSHDSFELFKSEMPYGVKINYSLDDDSAQISEEQFLRNSVLLFALIDNAEEVTHLGYWNNKALSSIPFGYTYTRADAERIVGGDVRQFAESDEKLAELIEVVQLLSEENTNIPTDDVERWKSKYAVIENVKFHVLISEYLDHNDKDNPDLCLLVREYRLFDGMAEEQNQVCPTTYKIALPKSDKIITALDFKNQININDTNSTSLRLPENTIVSDNVLNQWNEERYAAEYEYSKESPKGLTYEMLQKFS